MHRSVDLVMVNKILQATGQIECLSSSLRYSNNLYYTTVIMTTSTILKKIELSNTVVLTQ